MPGEVLGRVTASYRFLSWGATPIGAVTGGALAATVGPGAAFGAGLVLVILQGALAFLARDMQNYRGA